MRLVVDAARKDIGASIWRAHDQPALRRGAGLFGDLKLNRTAGLVLDNRRPVSHAAARSYVVDPKADEIVAISIAVALSDGNVVPLNSAFRWNNSMRQRGDRALLYVELAAVPEWFMMIVLSRSDGKYARLGS